MEKMIAYMLTCPERAVVRAQTLASWKASDWKRAPRLVVDRSTTGRPQDRQERAARALLRRAVREAAPWILFLEDDLEFNRFLRHNLENWSPLALVAPGGHFYGSLYNPNVSELERHPEQSYLVAWPKSVYGSQAVLLSRSTAVHILEHWDEVEGMQDIKMSRLAAQVCPLVFHSPSLVQHTGVRSVWGGTYHNARDYQATWKAFPWAGETRRRGERFLPIGSEPPDQAAMRLKPGAGPLPALDNGANKKIHDGRPLPDAAAIVARIRPIQGWLSDEEAGLLVRAVAYAARLPAGAMVEVGSFCGKGTVAIALTLKALGSRQVLYAVDTFSGTVSLPGGGVMHCGPTFASFSRNLASAGVRRQVRAIQSRSADLLWGRPLSLLLVDGFHDAINLRDDTGRFARWLVPGGLAIFHDCDAGFPSVMVWVKEICERGDFRLVEQAGSLAVLA